MSQRTPDKTMQQPTGGGGMDTRQNFMCGHKGFPSGALFKGRLPWRCAKCAGVKA